jgi:hypothetical protein
MEIIHALRTKAFAVKQAHEIFFIGIIAYP